MNPVEEDRALDGEDDPMAHGPRGRAAMDPTTRNLVWIAGGIALLLVVVIGGWALSGRHAGTIPVIEATAGPVRLKPVDPGGMQSSGAPAPQPEGSDGRGTLVPAPETPRPDALQAEVDAARKREAAPIPPATAPARPMPSRPAPVPKQPAPLPNGNLFRTEQAPETAPSRGAPGGALAVQLAALDSSEAARSEWSRLCRIHPLLFSGRRPVVEQADHDGRSIYRLRTSGFATMAAAASFCEQAHAERVACTVADF